ncbi:nuclear transport factor 2 family protein [Streptomyces sp. NPDC003753]|uniref:nuclear transport factor 2 family protein n=1 Tax=unclassified Streptomyces TaxID=2593676 RepID=UPI001903CE96|nr:nuclear transport factor 2 family protein [Streptomyces sp. Y2F8-2]GHK03648.1 ketosteroid isomerase [Streptomyces sp. Y2F8-2]
MTRNTSQTVQEFFNRFGSGDLPGLPELFAEDADLVVAGAATVPWTGHLTGRQEVEGYFRRFVEAVQTQRFDVERIAVDGEDAIVLGEFTHKVLSTGKPFSGPFAIRITVREGLIRRYQTFEDSYAAAIAFSEDS